ncbi:MAG: class I SAM-dependent methyltransferase [bacterium]
MDFLEQINLDLQQSQERGDKDDTINLVKLILNQDNITDTILDLGCNDGHYHKYFLDKYNFVGIDNIKQFKNNKNSIYYQHDLEQYPYDFLQNKFKIVICLDTIEHLYRPDIFLNNIYNNILEDSGKLLLCVPNVSCIDDYISNKHISLFNPNIKQFNNRWTSQHIRFFDPESIINLSESIGFKIQSLMGCNFYVSQVGKKIINDFNQAFNIPIEHINRVLGNSLPMFAPNIFLILIKE